MSVPWAAEPAETTPAARLRIRAESVGRPEPLPIPPKMSWDAYNSITESISVYKVIWSSSGRKRLGKEKNRMDFTNLRDGTDGIYVSSTSRLHANEREQETEEQSQDSLSDVHLEHFSEYSDTKDDTETETSCPP